MGRVYKYSTHLFEQIDPDNADVGRELIVIELFPMWVWAPNSLWKVEEEKRRPWRSFETMVPKKKRVKRMWSLLAGDWQG
ncbi:hypothetical protein KDK_68620 [Dictyobacter kobayashii]|uniref:Uncharacterized protein n=1 Tax=Dictyobacter kobayashii TaxID=2014872 RepID=A0A402AVC3_9CHLR|nr:hypothetical protein KDK_68620 [Dictyobacter kobayashii]